MSRSVEKGFYVEERLLKRVKVAHEKRDRKPIRTFSRRSTITPEFVGLSFNVYNGRKFQTVYVSENMVGHKLGEFSPTRIFKKHSTSQDKAKALAAQAKG